MNHVTDDDLLMLYYGEHDDPELARRVARSPELSERLRRLVRVLEQIDRFPVPEPEPDFGARVWHRIAARLEPPRARGLFGALLNPRLSLAGAGALVVVVLVAFWVGRQSHPAAAIDPQRLLAGQVSDHLGRADLLLTEYVNGPGGGAEAAWAAELLTANRIYRFAAERAGHARLARLLEEMETLLLELANDGGAQQSDAGALKDYVDEGLLFRVRVMQNNLVRSPDQA